MLLNIDYLNLIYKVDVSVILTCDQAFLLGEEGMTWLPVNFDWPRQRQLTQGISRLENWTQRDLACNCIRHSFSALLLFLVFSPSFSKGKGRLIAARLQLSRTFSRFFHDLHVENFEWLLLLVVNPVQLMQLHATFAGFLQNWSDQLSTKCTNPRTERSMRLSTHTI